MTRYLAQLANEGGGVIWHGGMIYFVTRAPAGRDVPLHFWRCHSAMRRPATDLRRRKYVARRRKPSQNLFRKS